MTDEKLIISRLEQLPHKLKLKVELYIETLLKIAEPAPSNELKPRKPGHSKGKYRICDDFEEPLEELQDYLPCDTSLTLTPSSGSPPTTRD